MMRRVFGLVGMMAAFSGLAQAQTMEGHDMAGMDAMGMPVAVSASAVVSGTAVPATTESESTKAYKAVDAKMHKDMMATGYTGDADVDFLRNMIPHHQGAVDMANVVLKYGTESDVRMMAGDIVKAQEKEIAWMKEWLLKHGPKEAMASEARVQVPATLPMPVVKKDIVTPTPPTMATTPIVVPAVVMSPSLVVTSSLPPVDKVSATVATTIGEATGPLTSTAEMAHDMPDAMVGTGMPEMPAADAEIPNTPPKMEFLDGPVLNMPAAKAAAE